MAFNLLKIYNQLLELAHFDEKGRRKSLYGVFNKDIVENPNFKFRGKTINPTKGDEDPLQILFTHLTTHIVDKVTRRREFEMNRSLRLHWIRFHVEEQKVENMLIFSVEDQRSIRTYIYDEAENYVIILEPYKNGQEYYLLTAYHVDKRNIGKIKSKYKRRLPDLY